MITSKILDDLSEYIAKWEDGNNHDEGAFDPDCERCRMLRELREIQDKWELLAGIKMIRHLKKLDGTVALQWFNPYNEQWTDCEWINEKDELKKDVERKKSVDNSA